MLKKLLLKLSNKYTIFLYFKKGLQYVRDSYYRYLSVNKDMVIFESFNSSQYSDSPMLIYEFLMNSSQYDHLKFVWAFQDKKKYKRLKNKRTKIVKHESHSYYKAFSKAGYWVVNGWIPLRIKKKANQTALQCWHGTPIKTLRSDIKGGIVTKHKENIYKNNEDIVRYDYLISTSKYNTEILKTAFNLKRLKKENIIIETGYPRNDPLVNARENERFVYRKELGIDTDKKIILYAPTWRDDQYIDGRGYEYNTPVDFQYIKEKLSSEYIILFRAHNFVVNQINLSEHEGFIYDVSTIDNVNKLYIVSDVLITDYSSSLFDYINLKKPIIFFMYDLDHYKGQLRSLYMDTAKLPGEVVGSEEELTRILNKLNSYENKWKKRQEEFIKEFSYLDDGNATKRVAEKVFKILA